MRRLLPAFAALVVIACASTPSNVRLPMIMQEVEPDFPDFISLSQARDRLTVEIEGVVGTSGELREAHVLNSPDHRLDDAALNAAQSFVFRPGTVDGAPADMVYQFTVRFKRRGI